MISNQRKLQHLYWRAGFGPLPLKQGELSLVNEIKMLFADSKKSTPLVLKDWNPLLAKEFKQMSDADKTAYRKQERQARLHIHHDILARYTSGKESLREKMTFFWMGHFACRIANPELVVKYFNTVNGSSLNTFGVLLKNMIRNAALLQYLNNNQNRKSSPNENFARELMELFTLGIGNYSELDVKEGARAMTGWGFDRFGEFVLRQEHHDNGIKKFLGEEGNFDGDDLVRILLSKKQCAHFITGKIYSYFVNDIPDEKLIAELSTKFYDSGYDTELLMKNIISSNWFYGESNTGIKIKSPVELIVGMIKNFKIKFENPVMAIQIQKVLGQMFFDPPNVAGWPGGRAWIDSSTLLYRMRLPELLLQDAESIIAPKEEFDALETLRADKGQNQNNKKVKTTFESTGFEKLFSGVNDSNITSEVIQYLLQSAPDADKVQLIENLTKGDKGPAKIFKTALYVMRLPEYQLC